MSRILSLPTWFVFFSAVKISWYSSLNYQFSVCLLLHDIFFSLLQFYFGVFENSAYSSSLLASSAHVFKKFYYFLFRVNRSTLMKLNKNYAIMRKSKKYFPYP